MIESLAPLSATCVRDALPRVAPAGVRRAQEHAAAAPDPPRRPRRDFIAVLAILATLVSAIPTSAFAGRPTLDEDLAILRVLRAGERWAQAESLATAVLARLDARRGADSLQIAEALHALGEARDCQRKWNDDMALRPARRSLEIRWRRLPPDHPLIAETETLLASVFVDADQPESSLVHARRALDISLRQPAPNDTVISDAWYNVGEAEYKIGDGHAALDAFEHSLEGTARAYGRDDWKVANVLCMIGDVWSSLGELEHARDVEEQALGVLDRGPGNDLVRSAVLSRLAGGNQDLGDLSRAIDAAQAAVRVAEASGDTSGIIATRFDLGLVLRDFGDDAGARAVFFDLLPLSERFHGSASWITGRIRQTLGGLCAALGDTAIAMRLDRQSEIDLLAHPEPQGSTVALSVEFQAELVYAQKRYREDLALNERAIRLAEAAVRADPGTLPYTRYLRIRILESLGDTAALDSARRDLAALRDRLGLVGTRSGPPVAYWLARADRGRGRPAEAWSGALEAEREERELLRLNVETLPDTRSLELARRKAYALGLVLDLADAAHTSRWDPAWDRLVRTRGFVRAELMRRRLPPSLRSDSAVVGARDAWVSATRRLARRLVRGPGATSDSAGRAELDAVRAAAEGAEAAYARALRDRGVDTARVEVGLADVRAQLAPGQALAAFTEVQHLDAPDRLIAFVARGGDPRVERIEFGRSDSLRALIAPWRERLETSPGPTAGANGTAERECRRHGERVRAATWDRLAPYLRGCAEVAIVPDGPLVDLPWHALPASGGGYLVERRPLVRVLDAERELIAPPGAGSGRAMLAMGDPDFDLARDSSTTAGSLAAAVLRTAPDPCAAGGPATFPRLPGTGIEAEAVAHEWQAGTGHEATVLRGPEATEAAFKRLAPGCAIVHLATHGVVIGDRCVEAGSGTRGVGGVEPIASGRRDPPRPASGAAAAPPAPSPWSGRRVWLALAGAAHARESGSDDDDGVLTADEVLTLDLTGTDWVVLSACHSGLAEHWSREGTLGMQRAFELAGARSVFASQWAVEDAATVDWMRDLYQVRSAGEARAAVALQATCRRVLAERRRAGRSTHPFYWAAFTASGE